MAIIEQGNVIGGILPTSRLAQVTLSAAQVRALAVTPQPLVPAPGAGYAIIIDQVTLVKAQGTAFGALANNKDFQVRYRGGGTIRSFETSGFLNRAAAVRMGTPAGEVAVDVGAEVEVAISNGPALTGGTPVTFHVAYHVLKV